MIFDDPKTIFILWNSLVLPLGSNQAQKTYVNYFSK